MSVLLFAEHHNGSIPKSVFEAATYGHDLAKTLGTDLKAVSVGNISDEELQKLGKYGVNQVFKVSNNDMNAFVNTAYAAVVSEVAKQLSSPAVVMSQTYNGKAIAPRIAVKLDATPLSGVISLVEEGGTTRLSYSGKGVQALKATKTNMVISVKINGYKITENPSALTVTPFDFEPGESDIDAVAKEIIKAGKGVSLTEADIVVSAGRGMQGPQNWGMIEELAALLGAATACSKPVADMDWRPHHEHVGQTGIQIAPNVYFAIGISGAIQHLAGVSSSKTIIVINKDKEAPFFKIADYGIIGDLFEALPKLIEAVKRLKASH